MVKFTVANTVYVDQPVDPLPVADRRLLGRTSWNSPRDSSERIEVPFELKHLKLTAGDVSGDGRRELPRGGYQAVAGADRATFTVR